MLPTQTHLIVLRTVCICAVNLTLPLPNVGSHNLSSNFLAALAGKMCEMLCDILKMGHNLKSDYGVCFLWNYELHMN
jgi:hypothetical protein